MEKRKTRKTSRSVKNLPAKTVKAKTAKGVKGGLAFSKVQIEYKPQKPDGSL